jgi:hypothetical protein
MSTEQSGVADQGEVGHAAGRDPTMTKADCWARVVQARTRHDDLKPYQLHWGAVPQDAPRSRECQQCGRAVPVRNVIVRWLGDEDQP